jgi:hypothetical protein
LIRRATFSSPGKLICPGGRSSCPVRLPRLGEPLCILRFGWLFPNNKTSASANALAGSFLPVLRENSDGERREIRVAWLSILD